MESIGSHQSQKETSCIPPAVESLIGNIYLFETTVSENKLLEHFKCLVKERNYLHTLTQREIGKLQASTEHASTAHMRMEYKQGREDLFS